VQNTLYLEIYGSLSEKEFSLDELVIKTKELFESEGMPGFVGMLLSLLDEHISIGLVEGKLSWEWSRCCKKSRWEYYSRSRKQFRTTVGRIKIAWRRLRCGNCGKTIVPLREFLRINPYQSKTAELERTVMEVVSEQSYRRSCKHMRLIGEIPMPKSTAHRWVMESGCAEMDLGKAVDVVIADGTGFNRRMDWRKRINNRGELKVVIGIARDRSVVPIGTWTAASWQQVAADIRSKTDHSGPIAKILISDGEYGLATGLADLANQQQRCHWHEIHDLEGAMRWDMAPMEQRRETQKRLAATIGIELPSGDYRALKDQDRQRIVKSTKEAKEKLDLLIKELLLKGYFRAAKYVKRARNKCLVTSPFG